MAISDHVSFESGVPNGTQLKRYGSTVVRSLVLTAAAGIWVVFWALIVRLHISMGDFVSAGFVGAMFVVPAVLAYAYYLRNSFWAD